MKQEDNDNFFFEQKLGQYHRPKPRQAFVQQLGLKLRAAMEQRRFTSSRRRWALPWKLTSLLAGTSTAAVVLLLVMLWPNASSSFASVRDQLRLARTVEFSMTLQVGGDMPPPPILATKTWFDADTGARTDVALLGATLLQTSSRWGEPSIVLDHLGKNVLHIPADPNAEQWLMRLDPAQFVKRLCADVGQQALPIDGQVIAGQSMEGFAIPGQSLGLPAGSRIAMWIDPASHLPARIQWRMQDPQAGSLTLSADNFVWNAPINQQDISLDQPAGYTSLEHNPIPAPSEEALLDALKTFALLSGGYYPGSQDSEELLAILGAALKLQTSHDATLPNLAQLLQQDYAEMIRQLIAGGLFYLDLVATDRQPRYFGHQTTSKQPDRILMQWQLPDGQQRIIYADLRTQTRPVID